MNRYFLGLGSNIGDRLQNLKKATELLCANPAIKITKSSNWYEAPALTADKSETQDDYLNGIIEISTSLTPQELLEFIQFIEDVMGRQRTLKKWDNRNIDIDILAHESKIIEETDLKIPHPEIEKRIFVLRPLCDIAPDWRHPVSDKSAKELLAALGEQEIRLFSCSS